MMRLLISVYLAAMLGVLEVVLYKPLGVLEVVLYKPFHILNCHFKELLFFFV